MNKYIYILVGIIWLVSNVYKSFRKKEAENSPTPPPDDPSDNKDKNIETILGEILTGKQLFEKEVVHEPFPVKPQHLKPKELRPIFSEEKVLDETPNELADNSLPYSEMRSTRGSDAKNSHELPVAADEEETFDLKNAVIYSEIIGKPKYLSDI